ncbi:MAG: porin family protein [Gemmatimonadales bacterium]
MDFRSLCCSAALAAGVVVISARPASAQFIQPGIMAGASLSTFTGDLESDAKNYAGFIAGAFVRIGALGFAVQPGVYYTAKGAKTSDFSETTGAKTTLDYIEIPIVIRLNLPMHLYVGAGPAIGVKLNCKFEPSNGPSSDCKDVVDGPQIKSTETDGILEAGLAFGKFSLGARGDFGLSNVAEAVHTGSTANVTARTKTLSAVLEIRF